MSTPGSCNVGASKSNDDDVCELAGKLDEMKTAEDNDEEEDVCANCGKEGANNICNKCKQVKYCNAACKKKHRHKHKKHCEEHLRLADERAAELHDERLFKQPPPKNDCPICFLLLPSMKTGYRYMSCCGKVICSGCMYAPVYDDQGNKVDNQKCPFCRTPAPKSIEEALKRLKTRMEAGDAIAIHNLGMYYRDGMNGCPQDYKKALEFWHQAAELGHADAYKFIGYAYVLGQGVEVDMEKANYYYEIAAKGGDSEARNNLGNKEARARNYDRAIKHYMIAVEGGNTKSLDTIKKIYSVGHATKEDYSKALQSYQVYLGEIKSKQRDEAVTKNIITISQHGLAAANDCRYY